MNPDGGYVRLYRRLWEHDAFRNRQEAAVFAWMVSAAAWKAGAIRTKWGAVALCVGEVIISERELSADFGLHRNTLRSLLHRMVDQGIITLIRDRTYHRVGTIARIENFSQYQNVERVGDEPQDRSGTINGTEVGPKQDRSGTKIKEEEEVNKSDANASDARAKPDKLDGFASWWADYPHKVGKGAAERAWPAARKLASPAELIDGVRRYVESKPPDRSWCNPATWLNQRRWLDMPAATVLPFERPPEKPSEPPPRPEDLWPDLKHECAGVIH